jgi:hypothetical protein
MDKTCYNSYFSASLADIFLLSVQYHDNKNSLVMKEIRAWTNMYLFIQEAEEVSTSDVDLYPYPWRCSSSELLKLIQIQKLHYQKPVFMIEF